MTRIGKLSQTFLLLFTLGINQNLNAALLFSEYIEGSGYNKALEIYNSGDTAVDLSSFNVVIYTNGNTNPDYTIPLSANIGAHRTYVVVHKRADAVLQQKAQLVSTQLNFNGDDFIALKQGNTFIDSIGKLGDDPGGQWGKGTTSTQDNTLVRKANVTHGNIAVDQDFDPALEWTGFNKDFFDNLGIHANLDNAGVCGGAATKIHLIQGSGAASPLLAQTVIVEAVVTGDFQGESRLNGFYVQEEDRDVDSNPETSEGLFVDDKQFGVEVNSGDRVRILGSVAELNEQTSLTDILKVQVCDEHIQLTPIVMRLPVSEKSVYEHLEGMYVQMPQTLVITDTENLGRYGSVVLTPDARFYTYSHRPRDGESVQQFNEANQNARIILDDGSAKQNPEKVTFSDFEFSAENSVRSGDSVRNLEGVLGYQFDEYRVQPTRFPKIEHTNPRPVAPQKAATSNLRIAGFNVLNYFNGDGKGGGFPTTRGATSALEFSRQQAKIIAALHALDADIITLFEIENDGYGNNSALQSLVDALNSMVNEGQQYTFVEPPTSLFDERFGGDAITIAMIYRADLISPAEDAASLSDYPFDNLNRQPLAQHFEHRASGKRFAIVANHLKSKRCGDATSFNTDQNDGQGCWNAIRKEASASLINWLNNDTYFAGIDDVLIMGDFNAYANEEPILQLENGGYHDLIKQFVGDSAYSYVFNGQAGYLDQALSTAAFATKVQAVSVWHINADEAKSLDYNGEFKSSEQTVRYYQDGPYRSSDHDPVIVDVAFGVDPDFKPRASISNGERTGAIGVIVIGVMLLAGLLTWLARKRKRA